MYADLMNLLLPILPSTIYHDVRRVQTLAWALIGICMTQTVRLGAWAEVVDSRAQLASSRVRRFARWVHQGAISPRSLGMSLCCCKHCVIGSFPGGCRWLLIPRP